MGYTIRWRWGNRRAITKRLERMMAVILPARSGFGLETSEAETTMRRVQTKGGEKEPFRSTQPARYTNKPSRFCTLGLLAQTENSVSI